MFAGISGLLIPGGAVSIYSSPYAEASNFLFDLAKMDNDAGDIFPVWGTCLGFEMLALMANDNVPNLKRCNSYDKTLPLDLMEGWTDSNLFGKVRVFFISNWSHVWLRQRASDGMSNYNFYLQILNKDFPHVRVCCQADSRIMDYLTRLPVTSNFHHWCLTRQNFSQ